MEERNVLSSEEVDAIIKSSREMNASGESDDGAEDSQSESINTHALEVIIDNTREFLSSKFTALFRKKISIKSNPISYSSLDELKSESSEGFVYSSYKINPSASAVMIVQPVSTVDIVINLLYGGKLQAPEDGPVKVGKVGIITAEKLGAIVLEGITSAMKEHGEMTYQVYKTSQVLQVVNNLPNEKLYVIELLLCFEELEQKIKLLLPEEFLIKYLQVKTGKGKHKEKDFWRTAIKREVIDSFVTVTTNMADIKFPLNRLLALKEGDEIEVADPAVVFVCLNDLKIYRGLAGQSNSKVVVKIVSQI